MFVLGAVAVILAGTQPVAVSDTIPDTPADSTASITPVAVPSSAWLLTIPLDTPTTRPRAVEIGEGYEKRLRLHRYLSYSIIPLFAAQYAAGTQLYDKSSDAPTWAKTTHRAVATTLVGVFGVNTVTGAWNWWESRTVPEGRALRTAHALMMLTAEAGFTYAGAKLSKDAQTDASKRRQHRTVALSSMGLTLASALMMRLWND